MDYRFLIIFIFISATNVKCQKSTSIEDTKVTDNNNTAKEIENVKVEEKIPTIKLPNLCTICKCTGNLRSNNDRYSVCWLLIVFTWKEKKKERLLTNVSNNNTEKKSMFSYQMTS